jgi:sensor histidine kinase YesM
MYSRKRAYWLCQVLGWSGYIILSIMIMYAFSKVDSRFVISLITTCAAFMFITHLMRYAIIKMKVLEKNFQQQILYFLGLTIITSIFCGMVSEVIDNFFGYMSERLAHYSVLEKIFLTGFNAFWLILIWNLIYYLYHYIENNRKQQMDTIRLENMVKTLELETIKSRINPHFIFNSLNSIRALVDENPARARKAITELSNIMRNSLQTDKVETVPFSKEMDIVIDYLELEHMRFEERLNIELDIDPKTNQLPIPPMMVQTLIENAIKHGISQSVHGGKIKIITKINNDRHEIMVQNTGQLKNNQFELKGFGIKSSIERLKILFGDAKFSMSNIPDNLVEAKVSIPLQTSLQQVKHD